MVYACSHSPDTLGCLSAGQASKGRSISSEHPSMGLLFRLQVPVVNYKAQ